jgi:GT2 family glycosyltransferase
MLCQTCEARTTAPGVQTADLDVGVIYTHERELMPRLLASLRDSAGGRWMRLVLVDNASTEGVGPWRSIVPGTLVLRNHERLSYAANLNRILAASTARYVLLLNTDMQFDPAERCLARMIAFMESRPDCGVAGCRIYHPDGRYAWPARRFQTLPVVLARRFGLGPFMRRTLDHYLYRDRSPYESFPCDWLSGCFLMVRREALADVGWFDEGFGKYFEDVDFCLRMSRAGWRVMYHGGTYCYHLEQRASKRLFSADAWRHFRAYLRWLRKWGRLATPAEPARIPPPIFVPQRRAA